MTNTPQKVVTRFAPSPTGFLHIGGVRTALYAYLYAKKYQGTFILRIEDTDKNREVDGSIAHIEESLAWLGLEYDFGPQKPGAFGSCLQSDRLPIYKKYAEQLIEKGYAYPDPYTEAEITGFREKAETEKRPFLFREHRPATFAAWDGVTPLRFKVPEIKRHTWTDAVRGELTAGEDALDDFVLIKADGYPTYNFAHIVDDHEMGVTHVMRGEEFISSTPKFLSVYEALEIPQPVLVTLPPIMGPDGKKKLSKRDGAKDLLDYRTDGYLPEAMRNFLALIGWNPGGDREMIRDEDLINLFSLEKIQRSGGAFNEEKLQWLNKEYLSLLTPVQQLEYVSESVPQELRTDRLERAVTTILERIHNRTEIKENLAAGEYAYIFSLPNYETDLLLWKNDTSVADSLPRLRKSLELLQTADFSTPEAIKTALWAYAEEVGRGELLWPLRVALSGKKQSPDPFTIAFIVGQTETLARIQKACDKISGNE